MSESQHDLLERLLDAHHLPCPVCGYDLHRLTQPRCTECGNLLRLKVILANPPLRWVWLTGLVAACLNAGCGLIMLLITLLSLHARRSIPVDPRSDLLPRGLFFTFLYAFELAMILSPLAALVGRRIFQSWTLWIQIPIVVLIAALGLIALIAMAFHLH